VRNSTRVLVLLIAGAIAGAAITLGVIHFRYGTPSYGFLNDEMNYRARAVHAQWRMLDWAKRTPAGRFNTVTFQDKIVVYPIEVVPMLTRDGVYMSASIAIRPAAATITTDEARATWEAASVAERAAAYEAICLRLALDLANDIKIDKSRIVIDFAAWQVTAPAPAPTWFRGDGGQRDAGQFKDGRVTMASRHEAPNE